MAGEKKSDLVSAKEKNEKLDAILDFGPDHSAQSLELTERIRAIVKKLEEINRRIDGLASRS